MIQTSLFVAERGDTDLLLAAAGLASAHVPDSLTTGERAVAAMRATLTTTAEAFLVSCRLRRWTDEAASAAEAAEKCVNAARAGAWPKIPAWFSRVGHDRFDFSLPVLWACEWIARELRPHGPVPKDVHASLGRLAAVCERRLALLRAVCLGEALSGAAPDLVSPCAELLQALCRSRSVLVFLPPPAEREPQAIRSMLLRGGAGQAANDAP